MSADGDGTTVVLSCGHEVLRADQSHYCSYIAWNGIQPFAMAAHAGSHSERPFHNTDEGLFIVVHQQSELSFTRVIADLELARRFTDEGTYDLAARHMGLATKWLGLVISTTHMLDSMDTALFMQPGVGFRDLVVPASGAESIAAREIELLAGMRADSPYMAVHGHVLTFRQVMDIPPGQRGRVARWWTHQMEKRASERSVACAFMEALVREEMTLHSVWVLDKEHSFRKLMNAQWHFEKKMLQFRSAHYRLTRNHLMTAEARKFIEGSADEVKGTAAQGSSTPSEAPPSALHYLKAVFRTARLFPQLYEFMAARDSTLASLLRLDD